VLDEAVPPALAVRRPPGTLARASAARGRHAGADAGRRGRRLAGCAAPPNPVPMAHRVAGRHCRRRAALAHAVYTPEVRHPVEVGADQQAHLVAWLSKRLGAQLKPPRLEAQGYALEGGRLLPGQSGPVAQFMYRDAGGARLTLYVSTEQTQNQDTGFRFRAGGIR
jgi:anti-sigma factor RsiW